jgi:hypothetical protein
VIILSILRVVTFTIQVHWPFSSRPTSIKQKHIYKGSLASKLLTSRSFPHTYPSAHNTIKYAHLSRCTQHYKMCDPVLITILYAPFKCVQHQNLVSMAHQPKCTFTFTIGTNNSPTYMYNLQRVRIKDTTIHSPLFFHYSQCIIYMCTHTNSKILKKVRILCSHSILALPCCILGTLPGPLDLYQPYCAIL